MRVYELFYLIEGDLPEERKKEVLQEVKNLLLEKSQILEEKEFGKRRLAYPIKKKIEGIYYLTYFSSPPDFIKRISTKLNQMEGVLRHHIERIDLIYKKYDMPIPGMVKKEEENVSN
jgi:small subunit ribosomal protein S6